jgi:segregation and condensation protein B
MADPMSEHRESPEVRRAIEAILMVAESPVEPQLLAQLLEVPVARVGEMCHELAAEYEEQGRGFALVAVAGGWRFQSHADLSPYVERFVLEGQSARLSGAALETLAIVAYKQPVSRAQVAAIRGVNVDGVMRTLQVRGFIEEVGKDPGPGQAVLFGTTALFLERLGLEGLDGLPTLSEFVPGADLVEHLEAGLRPAPGPSLGEQLDQLEAADGGPAASMPAMPSLDDED